MSTAERRAWTEVVLWSLALAFVWMRCTTGWELAGQSFGLQVVEQGPRRVFATYLGTGLFVAADRSGDAAQLIASIAWTVRAISASVENMKTTKRVGTWLKVDCTREWATRSTT